MARDCAGRAGRLVAALAWRTRHEGLGCLLTGFAPFAVVVALLSVLPSLTHGKGINGAASALAVSLRYGSGSLAMGLLLLLAPGLIAVFGGIGIARLARGLVGGEVSRGGMELLLGAPYTPGTIAAALLGYLLGAAVTFWAALTALTVLAVTGLIAVGGGHLVLSGGYLAEALLLPLLAMCASCGLAVLVSLLFPRLTQVQLSAGVNMAGGSLDSLITLLPTLALLTSLAFGGKAVAGSAGFCAAAAGVAVAIAAVSVGAVSRGFRPEAVLES